MRSMSSICRQSVGARIPPDHPSPPSRTAGSVVVGLDHFDQHSVAKQINADRSGLRRGDQAARRPSCVFVAASAPRIPPAKWGADS
jgi:hypothetical protein